MSSNAAGISGWPYDTHAKLGHSPTSLDGRFPIAPWTMSSALNCSWATSQVCRSRRRKKGLITPHDFKELEPDAFASIMRRLAQLNAEGGDLVARIRLGLKLFLADNGSDWYFQGAAQRGWPTAFLDELKSIPAGAFVAVDESCLMIRPGSGRARAHC